MFIYTFLTKQATFHINCHDKREQQRWRERRRTVQFSILSDCHAQHHMQVWSTGVEELRACACACAVLSERVCVCVCACTPIRPVRKTQTLLWVLKTMHILISLIIHPYVTDERILVSVSGAGNVQGGGPAKGGRALFKAQMTVFLQEPEPPPVHSAGWDETLTRTHPCDVERN